MGVVLLAKGDVIVGGASSVMTIKPIKNMLIMPGLSVMAHAPRTSHRMHGLMPERTFSSATSR